MNQKFNYLDIRLLNFVFFCNIILFMVIDSVGNEVYNKFVTTPSDVNYMVRSTNGKREISLSSCTDDTQNRIIILVTKNLFGSSEGIEKIHIQDLIKLCNNNIGNKYLTPNKNLKVLVKNRKIFFIAQNN